MILTTRMVIAILNGVLELAPNIIPLLMEKISKDASLTTDEINFLIDKLKKHKLPTWENLNL
jgi:hypothetical protein